MGKVRRTTVFFLLGFIEAEENNWDYVAFIRYIIRGSLFIIGVDIMKCSDFLLPE